MRYISLLLFTLASLQIYAQPQSGVSFTKKLFVSDFAEADKDVWPLKNTSSYSFLIHDGRYAIESYSDNNRTCLIPNKEPIVSELRTEAALTIDEKSDKTGAAGLGINIRGKLESGYVAELNKKGEFRVLEIKGQDQFNPLTEGANGWAKSSYINKAGSENILSVFYYSGQLQVIINTHSVWITKISASGPAGFNGIFLDGKIVFQVSHYVLYGKTAKDSTTGASDCGQKVEELSSKNDALNLAHQQDQEKIAELQKFIQQNLDVKLQAQLARKNKEVDSLNAVIKDITTNGKGIPSGPANGQSSASVKQLQAENKKLREHNDWLEWQLRVYKKKAQK